MLINSIITFKSFTETHWKLRNTNRRSSKSIEPLDHAAGLNWSRIKKNATVRACRTIASKYMLKVERRWPSARYSGSEHVGTVGCICQRRQCIAYVYWQPFNDTILASLLCIVHCACTLDVSRSNRATSWRTKTILWAIIHVANEIEDGVEKKLRGV